MWCLGWKSREPTDEQMGKCSICSGFVQGTELLITSGAARSPVTCNIRRHQRKKQQESEDCVAQNGIFGMCFHLCCIVSDLLCFSLYENGWTRYSKVRAICLSSPPQGFFFSGLKSYKHNYISLQWKLWRSGLHSASFVAVRKFALMLQT